MVLILCQSTLSMRNQRNSTQDSVAALIALLQLQQTPKASRNCLQKSQSVRNK